MIIFSVESWYQTMVCYNDLSSFHTCYILYTVLKLSVSQQNNVVRHSQRQATRGCFPENKTEYAQIDTLNILIP